MVLESIAASSLKQSGSILNPPPRPTKARESSLALPRELQDAICNHLLVDLQLHVKRALYVKNDETCQSESFKASNQDEWATLYALRRTSHYCRDLVDDSLLRAKEHGQIAVVVDGTDPENNSNARIEVSRPMTPRSLECLISTFCVFKIILPISVTAPGSGCVRRLTVTAKRAIPIAPVDVRTFSWTNIRFSQDPQGTPFTPAFRAIEDKIRRVLFTTSLFKEVNNRTDGEKFTTWMIAFRRMISFILLLRHKLPHHPLLNVQQLGMAQQEYRTAVVWRQNAEECAKVARERSKNGSGGV